MLQVSAGDFLSRESYIKDATFSTILGKESKYHSLDDLWFLFKIFESSLFRYDLPKV